jgi:hypothetical protein
MYDVYVPRPPPLVGDAPPVDSYRPPTNPATLTFADGTEYALVGFHFHAPRSEHTIDGRPGALELHFVFQQRRRMAPAKPNAGPIDSTATSSASADGRSDDAGTRPELQQQPAPAQAAPRLEMGAAVVAVLFDEGPESAPWLRTVLDVAMPPESSIAQFPEGGKLIDLDLSEILPGMDSTDVYQYMGSLTTPPGTEGVRWIVLAKRSVASAEDVALLETAQGGPNVRPLQPLGDRRVWRSPAAVAESYSSDVAAL